MTSKDYKAMQDTVARGAKNLELHQSEYEAAVEQRMRATTEDERRSAIARAVVAQGRLRAAQQQLTEAKRALARAQGDTYDHAETRTI